MEVRSLEICHFATTTEMETKIKVSPILVNFKEKMLDTLDPVFHVQFSMTQTYE